MLKAALLLRAFGLLLLLSWANLCVAQLLQPTQPTPPLPPMCSTSTCIFRILFMCDKCCRRRQISYGERTQLLLQLLVLQPCMLGMVVGVPSKVPQHYIVFPTMNSLMLNFLSASTTSTPIISYENVLPPPLLAMREQPIMRMLLLWVLPKMADVSHLSFGLYK